MNDPIEMVTVAEFARRSGVCVRTVWTWISDEGLPVFRTGRLTRIRVADAAAWQRKRCTVARPACVKSGR